MEDIMTKLIWMFVKRILLPVSKTYLKIKWYDYLRTVVRPLDWIFIISSAIFGFAVIVEILFMLVALVEYVSLQVGFISSLPDWPFIGQTLIFHFVRFLVWGLSV